MASFTLKVENTNKLYFNKFKYKARVKIQGVNLTYYLNSVEQVEERIEKYLGEQRPYKPMSESYYKEIDIKLIEKYLIWRSIFKDKVTFRLSQDSVSVFSNDLNILKSLNAISRDIVIYEAQVLKTDTLFFKKTPKYTTRTYFKNKRIPNDFLDSLKTFIKNYDGKPGIFISKTLKRDFFSRSWHPYIYLHGSVHIDYNDDSFLSVLYMYFPGMVGKTYKLEKLPKTW